MANKGGIEVIMNEKESSVIEREKLMVKAAGLVLFVISLTYLPKALSGALSLMGILFMKRSLGQVESSTDVLMQSSIHQSMALNSGHIFAFLIFFYASKWMFGFPDLARQGFKRTNDAA